MEVAATGSSDKGRRLTFNDTEAKARDSTSTVYTATTTIYDYSQFDNS
jgi:hypothetical protein